MTYSKQVQEAEVTGRENEEGSILERRAEGRQRPDPKRSYRPPQNLSSASEQDGKPLEGFQHRSMYVPLMC